jgi:hypothetical protein
MPARLVQVTLINNSDYPIRWLDDGRPHGFWQDPWFPSNVKDLRKGQTATWRQESGGVATGVEGWARFLVDVPFATNVGDRSAALYLHWDRPYLLLPGQLFEKDSLVTPNDPASKMVYLFDHGYTDIANMDSSPFEFIPALPGGPLSGFVFLPNEAVPKHVAWIVELRNIDAPTVLPGAPLEGDTSGVIYAVDPRIEAAVRVTGGTVPASGGHLWWFQHEGREDGTFNWTDNKGRKVGTGWAGFERLFPGGGGIIYAVDPVVPATVRVTGGSSRESGGDLWWYRHLGHEDGTFNWEDRQKVGTGWGGMEHVFSSQDGIIYLVDPLVEAGADVESGTSAASGGDLWWYRHLGHEDGTFRWDERKKVGTGWSGFKHLFSGGGDIIYAVDPVVQTGVAVKGGATPTSGGDLWWYRHVGHDDGTFRWEGPKKVGVGWGGFEHLFSGGDGVIYAITRHGDLLWFRHEGRDDGSFRWTDSHARKVGTGWIMKEVFCG